MVVDVLNLEWMSYSARDRNISSLICNYLRFQGYKVVEESIFRGYEMIDKYKPKLVFVANGIGAKINFQIVKYASLKGIKVVTLVSEGNFKDSLDTLDQFLWGWNKDHRLYEDSYLQWSERTRKLSLSKYPGLNNIIKVSGGCGFDIYKIKPPIDKKSFLSKFNKERYTKVIGVGCWDFTPCYPDNPRSSSKMSEEVKARFRKDRDLFNKILVNIINANPSVLFILKEHPGNILGYDMSGIDGAEKYENALILKKEPIIDVIAVSDIWLTYESTTVFEAWMLGKQTCLLNPTGLDFPRANVYLGSPNYVNKDSLQSAIYDYYTVGSIPHFNDEIIEKERTKVIKDTIQWDDGLNHVRAGNEIIRILENKEIKRKKHIPLNLQIDRIRQKLVNNFKISKSLTYQRSHSFKQDEVQAFSSSLYLDQQNFYRSLNISKEELLKIKPI